MPSPTELEPAPEWPADDLEMEIDMSDDDDFDFEDAEEEEENEELIERRGSAGNVPVWRLIEMSREDRYLKRELADFEDYDRFADDYVGVSH